MLLDLDRPLVVAPELVRAQADPGCVDLVHVDRGSRLSLGTDGWALLRCFRGATTPRAVAESLTLRGEDLEAFGGVLCRLLEVGALEPHAAEARVRAPEAGAQAGPVPTETPFLNASTQAVARADVHVIGLPFDRGGSHSGSAAGPSALRKASLQFPCHPDPFEAVTRGVLDRADGRILLEGARLLDHGDLQVDHWLSLEDSFSVIRSGIAALPPRDGGVLVVLGGDHSVTVPVVQGLPEPPSYVVHLDAHSDLGAIAERVPHHHGSFASALAALPCIEGIVQIGLRDFAEPWRRAPDGVRQIGARTLRSLTPAEIVAPIPPRARCYVTIDIDVLDPSVAPGTGIPVPGGPDPYRLEEILEHLADERDVVAVDLVEVDPSRDRGNQTALIAVRLLLRLLDAIHRRRRASSASASARPSCPIEDP